MFLYIVIFLILFLLSMIDTSPRLTYQSRKSIYILLAFCFFILSFIRWETGTDWDPYLSYFRDNSTIEGFKEQSLEPFYMYINYWIKQFTDSYTVVLFVVALIIFPFKYSTIWKLSLFPFFSLLLYLLMNRCDIFFVRETIALAIAMYSIKFIIEKKLLYFLIVLLIAMMFHSSIVVFVFAYYIYHMELTTRKLWIIAIGSVVAIAASTALMSFLGSNIGGMIGWKISSYMEHGSGETFGTGLSVGATILRGTINRSIFMVMYIYTYLKYRTNPIVTGLVKIYMTNFVLFLIACPINVALARICNSYEQVSVILISYFLMAMGKQNRKPMVLLLSMYFFIRFYMSTLAGGYSEYFIPYKSIFSV